MKIQYPGAGQALLADLSQLSRLAGLFKVLQPGLDVKPLLAELRARITEELDYELEAKAQRGFATAYKDDDEIFIPERGRLVAAAVLVTEWIDGTPLSQVIASGTRGAAQPRRLPDGDTALLRPDPGRAAARRPAPGQLPDAGRRPPRRARLRRGGPAARRPPGADRPPDPARPRRQGRRRCWTGCAPRASSSRRSTSTRTPFSATCVRCWSRSRCREFQFTRAWLRAEAARLANPRSPAFQLGKQLNLPPSYLLIHRVTLGSIGVLCQLEARAPYRVGVERWLPGLRSTKPTRAAPESARSEPPARPEGRAGGCVVTSTESGVTGGPRSRRCCGEHAWRSQRAGREASEV